VKEVLKIQTNLFAGALPFLRKCISNKNITVKIKNNTLTVYLKQNSEIIMKEIGIAALNALTAVITGTMKRHYIKSHLYIQNDALIKALAKFDTDTDETMAFSLIKITPQILLDSYYYFRLFPLLTHWNEVIALVNDNAKYLCSKPIFNEFLTFLNNTQSN
jgi:hypothetical protein